LKAARHEDLLPLTQRNLRRGAIAATVASALMLGYIGTTLYRADNSPRDVLMPPVIASSPEAELIPITTSTPVIMASVSAGLTIWPAALFAEQAPVSFAHSKLELANYTR
jgi:hypothetical protein